MKKRDFNFEVDTIESGQRNPYGDSYYHYIISSKQHESTVLRFCTNVLSYNAIKEKTRKSHIEKQGFGGNFTTYYTEFKKIDDNMYEYKCVSPSTH